MKYFVKTRILIIEKKAKKKIPIAFSGLQKAVQKVWNLILISLLRFLTAVNGFNGMVLISFSLLPFFFLWKARIH